MYSKIEIWDESIYHTDPRPHLDFVYSYISYHVPPEIASVLHNVSTSIGYDPLKQELRARCGSLEANAATLYLCVLLAEGKYDISDIVDTNVYGNLIDSTSKPGMVTYFETYLYDAVHAQNGSKNTKYN